MQTKDKKFLLEGTPAPPPTAADPMPKGGPCVTVLEKQIQKRIDVITKWEGMPVVPATEIAAFKEQMFGMQKTIANYRVFIETYPVVDSLTSTIVTEVESLAPVPVAPWMVI